jgi:SAM-dependent methyltransferase
MNKSDLAAYRRSAPEEARMLDLLRILPPNRRTVLDVGARDGHFSRLLANHFREVTALDLQRPTFEIERVATVAGNVTGLTFDDESFDCVFCAEVLEHIPDIAQACAELMRVAKFEVIVGVPFRQEIRAGRTSCRTCGKISPPWGHLHSFTEESLLALFPGMRVVSRSFVGTTRSATSVLATFLMDAAGNPWGTYDQEEPCVHCGACTVAPGHRPLWQRACSFAAVRMNNFQTLFAPRHAQWIHVVLARHG